MKALQARLARLERPFAGGPYAHLTDEEVEARYAAVRAELEGFGIVFPEGFNSLPWHHQAAWLQQAMSEESAPCG